MFLTFVLIFIILGSTANAFSCPPGAVPTRTNKAECYLFSTNNLYYLEAEDICEQNGGHLVSIHNMMDNMFITQEAFKAFDHSTSGDFWFGISNIISGTWSWMDSSPYDFVNWNDESTLNRTDSLCGAVLFESGKWINDYCFIKKPFVCIVPALLA